MLGVAQRATKVTTSRFVIHVLLINIKSTKMASVNVTTKLHLIVQLVPTICTTSKPLVATCVPMVAPLATTTLTIKWMCAMFVKKEPPLAMACALLTKLSALMVKLNLITRAMIVQMGVHLVPWTEQMLLVKNVHQALS